jgi:hypothetical protein
MRPLEHHWNIKIQVEDQEIHSFLAAKVKAMMHMMSY